MTAFDLDWPATRAGALTELAVIAPVVAVYTVLHASGAVTGDGPTIVTAVIAVLVAPFAGGAVAARRAPLRPLTTSATATAIGVVVYVVFRAADAVVRGRSLSVGAVVILIMLSVLLGVVGGLVGSRTTA